MKTASKIKDDTKEGEQNVKGFRHKSNILHHY